MRDPDDRRCTGPDVRRRHDALIAAPGVSAWFPLLLGLIGGALFYVIPHESIIEGDFAGLLMAIKANYKPDQRLEPKLNA